MGRLASLDYGAHPKQRRFHASRAPVCYLRTGYGGGKSYALAHEAVALAAVNPGLIGGAVSATYPLLRDTLVRDIAGVLGRAGIRYTYHRTDHIFHLPWGSEIHCRSADKPESLKGPNWAWAVGDEIALWEHESWRVFLSRVRDNRATRRVIRLGGTPEGGLSSWVVDTFDDHPRPGYELVQAHTSDNPGLPREYIEALEADYDEAHLQAYLAGEPVDLYHGPVYQWSRDRHVAEFETPTDGELSHSFDFNVDPACSIVLQRTGMVTRVIDEIVIRGGADTDAVCSEFIARYGDWPGEVIVYGDASGGARSTKAAVSDYQIIAQRYGAAFGRRFLGARVPASNPAVVDRVNAVNRDLRAARILVHPRCRALIADMARTVWREGTREIDKRKKDVTHLSDALGYHVVREAPIRIVAGSARKIAELAKAGRSRFAGGGRY